MESQFKSYKVNQEGIKRIGAVRQGFDDLLDILETLIGVPGRELSIVTTKLEEASFFAVKAISKANQE